MWSTDNFVWDKFFFNNDFDYKLAMNDQSYHSYKKEHILVSQHSIIGCNNLASALMREAEGMYYQGWVI